MFQWTRGCLFISGFGDFNGIGWSEFFSGLGAFGGSMDLLFVCKWTGWFGVSQWTLWFEINGVKWTTVWLRVFKWTLWFEMLQ